MALGIGRTGLPLIGLPRDGLRWSWAGFLSIAEEILTVFVDSERLHTGWFHHEAYCLCHIYRACRLHGGHRRRQRWLLVGWPEHINGWKRNRRVRRRCCR